MILNPLSGRSPLYHLEKTFEDDAFIYVADSAMVTEENLAQADCFITRLSATYNECERAILDAVDADQWREVGELSVTPASKNRPNASYRVQEQTVTLYKPGLSSRCRAHQRP